MDITKTCKTCNELKPVSEFYKHPKTKDGYFPECKLCNNIRSNKWNKEHIEQVRENSRRSQKRNEAKNKITAKIYYDNHRDKGRIRKRNETLNKRGLTPETFNELLLSQNGVCAICANPTDDKRWKVLHIDHDHLTNTTRGLLCVRCNTALGKVCDDITLLEKMIEYLRKHGKKF